MVIETQILVGDVVELSPSKMSTLDDLDLEKATVLEIDKENDQIKLVFNNHNDINETQFPEDSTVDWFSTIHVIAVERDYKVMELTDNQDTVTGQEVCIIKMARLKKTAVKIGQGYALSAVVDENDTDSFILAGFAAHELDMLEGTINRINFSQYKLRDAAWDDVPIRGWQPKSYINSPDDIFSMQGLFEALEK